MTCPYCTGPGVLLGTLGTLDHYRCRNCGAVFDAHNDDGEDDPEVARDAEQLFDRRLTGATPWTECN